MVFAVFLWFLKNIYSFLCYFVTIQIKKKILLIMWDSRASKSDYDGTVLWDETLSSLVDVYERFGGMFWLYLL
jgi:hypothetical protein